jgi:hypothetical protein
MGLLTAGQSPGHAHDTPLFVTFRALSWQSVKFVSLTRRLA